MNLIPKWQIFYALGVHTASSSDFWKWWAVMTLCYLMESLNTFFALCFLAIGNHFVKTDIFQFYLGISDKWNCKLFKEYDVVIDTL